MMKIVIFLFLLMTVTGCMNVPEFEPQITEAYASPINYGKHDCPELAIKTSSSAKNEKANISIVCVQ